MAELPPDRDPWYPRNPDAFEGWVTIAFGVLATLALIAFVTSAM